MGRARPCVAAAGGAFASCWTGRRIRSGTSKPGRESREWGGCLRVDRQRRGGHGARNDKPGNTTSSVEPGAVKLVTKHPLDSHHPRHGCSGSSFDPTMTRSHDKSPPNHPHHTVGRRASFKSEARYPQVRLIDCPCTSAGSTRPSFDRESFVVMGPFALIGPASYPVSIRRPAGLAFRFFRHSPHGRRLTVHSGRCDLLPRGLTPPSRCSCWAHKKTAARWGGGLYWSVLSRWTLFAEGLHQLFAIRKKLHDAIHRISRLVRELTAGAWQAFLRLGDVVAALCCHLAALWFT